jgi:dsDNA-binding SOS-regulon protein
MKQLEVFNKIGGIINELNEQYKYLEDNPENLNELELELFVANAHFLADHAEVLSKLNKRNKVETPAEVSKPAVAEKFFEPVVQQPKREIKPEPAAEPAKTEEPAATIDLPIETPKDTHSFVHEDPEVIRHELIVDDADYDEDEEELADEELTEEIAEEKPKPEQPVVIDKPVTPVQKAVAEFKELITPTVKEIEVTKEVVIKDKEEVLTINQRISAQLNATGNAKEPVGAQAIDNLKLAITLNDKLLYIKDLFNGYSLAYSEAIEILNRFNTFEEANRFLTKNYTEKNKWENKPQTAEKFFELLKRRYN